MAGGERKPARLSKLHERDAVRPRQDTLRTLSSPEFTESLMAEFRAAVRAELEQLAGRHLEPD
jgi:hypothetical protein